jgi:hypothetical protein
MKDVGVEFGRPEIEATLRSTSAGVNQQYRSESMLR